ncbi:nitroreductase family protein [Chloroflexota bacterium]
MLGVWDAIKTRRSIRKFRPDDISDEMIEQMLEAARLALSASNRQPWRFLAVRDKEIKKELRRICVGQKFIEEAPVVFVCFGDTNRYSMDARKKRRQEFKDFGVLETLSGKFADPEYQAYMDAQPTPTREELITPVTANTYIAIEHIVLMAQTLGLGSCWIGGVEDATDLNRLFNLPDTFIPLIVLPVGYPESRNPSPRPRLDREDIIIKPEI